MGTQAITNPSLEDVNVSGGVTRPYNPRNGKGEVPLWLGVSNVKVNGNKVVMGVTRDRKTYWLRFKVAGGILPDAMHEQMQEAGWDFAKRTRLAYWQDSSPAVVAMLHALGYEGAVHLVSEEATDPKQLIRNLQEEAPSRKRESKAATPPVAESEELPKYVRNSAGKWMVRETGKLAAKDDVLAWFESQVNGGGESGQVYTRETAAKEEAPSREEPPLFVLHVPSDDEVDAHEYEDEDEDEYEDDEETMLTVAHATGYEDGEYEGRNPETPDLYSRLAMARHAGVTVEQLTTRMGDDYIIGFLEGFASARPKQAKKGLLSRMFAK